MPATVLFHRLAADEYRGARKWYSARSEIVAEKFRQAVVRAVARIEGNPEALPILISKYRYSRVARFPYILVFRSRDVDSLMVVAVAHTSRRPGYWRRSK